MTNTTINYEDLSKEALRQVVKQALTHAKKDGLSGDHHFYISFYINDPGVAVSDRLKAQYPEEMTIVLQHQFWGLEILDDKFKVELSFSGIPEKLVIPYKAIKVFYDPSVPFGLQFDEGTSEGSLSMVAGTEALKESWLDQTSPAGGDETASQEDIPAQSLKTQKFSKKTIKKQGGLEEKSDMTSDDKTKTQNSDETLDDNSEKIVSLDAFRKK